MSGVVDGATNLAREGTSIGKKLFNFARNSAGVLTLSTIFAVATGGVSLAADPTLTAAVVEQTGAAVAAAPGAINVGLEHLANMTIQGVQHNLGLAIEGLNLL